ALARLSAIHPRLLRVLTRAPGSAWPDGALAEAEARARASGQAALAAPDLAQGRYTLVQGAGDSAYALVVALSDLVPEADWPMERDSSPVHVALGWQEQLLTLQPGRAQAQGWRFDFRKRVAAGSQPFEVIATRWVGWRELPWLAMGAWALAVAAGLAGWRHLRR